MSTNVEEFKNQVLDATMKARDIVNLIENENAGDNWCEDNFIPEHGRLAKQALLAGKPDEPIKLKSFHWRSTWSGNSFDYFKQVICKLVTGHIESVIIWEGGDANGLIVRDGVVTECTVEYKLVSKTVRRRLKIKEGLTVINSQEVGDVLRKAAEVAREPHALHMLLAITAEYSYLMLETTPADRAFIREETIKEAREQARDFWRVVHGKAAPE